jgi:Mg-chelatase subunit ChlD
MEIKNISEGPVNDDLFSIPAGYTKMDMSGGPGSAGGAKTAAAEPATQSTEPKPAFAQQPPEKSKGTAPGGAAGGNLVFILDASGSMWGRVEGKEKIVIAKEVLTGLIQDLPDDAGVGLVAYGHRSKGDCKDVEELVPQGPVDKETLISKIQAINPKGKTPITLSVRMTAEKLKSLEDETTIILVSDGKETC